MGSFGLKKLKTEDTISFIFIGIATTATSTMSILGPGRRALKARWNAHRTDNLEFYQLLDYTEDVNLNDKLKEEVKLITK